MKLKILSDIHLEFSNYKIQYDNEDILVLAGDISPNPDKTTEHIIKYLQTNRQAKLIYVLGNHDYYNKSIEETLSLWKDMSDYINSIVNTRFWFLHDDSVVINGIRFFGTTLWTDMNDKDTATMEIANANMSDYSYIKDFTPSKSVLLHEQSKTFLSECLDISEEPVVVITHHLPSFMSILPKYKRSITSRYLNGAFASNMDYLIDKSMLWIHGHTHSSLDYKTGKSRVVCNPRGYCNNSPENLEFKDDFIISINHSFHRK